MVCVRQGDQVTLHYTVKKEDGTVLESTKEKDPVTFTQGQGKVVGPVDEALLGMELGQEKSVFVSEEDGHGPHKPDLVVQIEENEFTQRDIKPEIGLKLRAQQPDGKALDVTVVDVSDSKVTLDANHPLAGQALTYDLELVGID